jgi:hypothetical protein
MTEELREAEEDPLEDYFEGIANAEDKFQAAVFAADWPHVDRKVSFSDC